MTAPLTGLVCVILLFGAEVTEVLELARLAVADYLGVWDGGGDKQYLNLLVMTAVVVAEATYHIQYRRTLRRCGVDG